MVKEAIREINKNMKGIDLTVMIRPDDKKRKSGITL